MYYKSFEVFDSMLNTELSVAVIFHSKKQRSKAACQRVIKRFDTFKNYRVNSLPAYFADVIKLLKIKSY